MEPIYTFVLSGAQSSAETRAVLSTSVVLGDCKSSIEFEWPELPQKYIGGDPALFALGLLEMLVESFFCHNIISVSSECRCPVKGVHDVEEEAGSDDH